MEPLGTKLRRQRRRLGLTLDELAGRTAISKPYLSLIETGRVPNPPSDEKLRRLEQTLGFPANELVTQAHLQRTPQDVRAALRKLIEASKGDGKSATELEEAGALAGLTGASGNGGHTSVDGNAVDGNAANGNGNAALLAPPAPAASKAIPPAKPGIDLDDAYVNGVLHDLVGKSRGGTALSGSIPVINRVSAGYPRDFTDLSYPPRVADEYVGCPDLRDKDAFAARVHGDSMTPKYRPGDIVIFSPALSPRSGDDCFVRFADGQTTFKRVFFETSEEGRGAVLRLQPRNEKYPPRVVQAEQAPGVFRAVYRYQRVDEE